MSNVIIGLNGSAAKVTAEEVPSLPEAPVDEGKFFFKLAADETGITELKFRKHAERVFGVVLYTLEQINSTFDVPFPSTGDFCRHLGTVADQVEAAYKQRQEEANGQAANDAGPDTPEAA